MSLSETVVKKTECLKCGAEVRPDSQFCYNCGEPVVKVADDSNPTNGLSAPKPIDEKVPAPGLRTAREIKRRERVFARKPTEVIWEPVSSTPDKRLLVATAIVLLFTVVVIILAFSLR